ncbi:MAG: hypothetical protein KDK23_17365 [Leptospiraceae bacterium]|nr:hypothetical protein [Leptospiraceae bacterium]
MKLGRSTIIVILFIATLATSGCHANYYVQTAETQTGEALALPARTVAPMDVCLVMTVKQDEIRELLEARGHRVTVLDPKSLEPLEAGKPKKCDVVALLERMSYEAGKEPGILGEIAAGFTFFSLGIIPSKGEGYARYTYQIIDTKNRRNERIQTQLTGHNWWSSLFYPLFNAIQQSGQYGRVRTDMNLRVIAAIEGMGSEGRLPLE